MTNSFFRNNTADQDKRISAEQQVIDGLVVLLQRVSTSAYPLALRLDDAGGGVLYVGMADPGASESANVWRIKKVLTTGSDIAILWPDGSGEYVNAWADRATLNYV